jgi:hypothetical protein
MKVDVSMNKMSYGLRARDYAGSAAGFLTVLGILVIMDQRVSFKIAQLITRGPAGEVAPLAKSLSELGSVLASAVKDQSIDHAPMLVFTAVAILLVGFMVRT